MFSLIANITMTFNHVLIQDYATEVDNKYVAFLEIPNQFLQIYTRKKLTISGRAGD